MSGDNDEPRQGNILDLSVSRLARQREADEIAYDPSALSDLSEQHNGVTGRFSELSKAYKADPTLENYVSLRRSNPGELIEIATSWSMDWLLSNGEVLKGYNIDPETVAGALDADPACISEVSLRLMECLIEREARAKSGETQLQSRGVAIGNSLVNYLIAMMLDALDWNDELYIPRDLMVLIKHQMGTDASAESRTMEVHTKQRQAVWLAAQLRYQGQSGTIRQVAKLLQLNASTVSRWFAAEGSFEREVDKFLVMLNSDFFADFRARLDDLKD